MKFFFRIRSPVLIVGFFLWSCGGKPDPVIEMQESLASAPEYMILLEDMREDGTFSTDYYHRYKVIQGSRERVTGWIEVSESTFRKYEPFLGMALVAKSDQGVNKTPHPPGYHYTGNPQYGRWTNRGGSSFWEFYGQYAMMQNLMGWGGRTVYRTDYDDYRTSQNRGRPYYGRVGSDRRTREFGTRGSITQKQKPKVFERRKQAAARKRQSFAQKVQSRTGRSRSGYGSRGRGGK